MFLSSQVVYSLSYATLGALLLITKFVIVPANLQMGLFTAAIIFVGAHQSLRLNETDPATGKRTDSGETLSKKDAMMFPVFGSAALVSLYVCYKVVGKEYMNLLLTTYIMLAGVLAVGQFLSPLLTPFLPWTERNWKIHFRLPAVLVRLTGATDPEFRLNFSTNDLIVNGIGLVLAVKFLLTKSFTIHNLFGVSFSIQAIRLISIGQFLNGFILLWGLFVYDVFWVFGTDVMVTVAMSFEAPAKIIFVQSFEPYKYGILGLGDIVIPGIFMALCLRFDDHLNRLKRGLPVHRPAIDIHEDFPKTYFLTVCISYLAGLGLTAAAMHLMNHAQPALLYLVPCTTLSVACVALLRGDLKEMLKYQESDEVTVVEKKNE
jgi:minor histocompatibility antigen H13